MGKITDQNKTVLFTGGTGSIGRSCIAHLLAAEYNVYFTSRSEHNINEMENSYKNVGGFIRGIAVDFSSSNYIEVLDNYFMRQSVHPSILVNNMRVICNLKVNDYGLYNIL